MLLVTQFEAFFSGLTTFNLINSETRGLCYDMMIYGVVLGRHCFWRINFLLKEELDRVEFIEAIASGRLAFRERYNY
jgi:hypothetical protein